MDAVAEQIEGEYREGDGGAGEQHQPLPKPTSSAARWQTAACAELNATLADGIVAARHGWWQACPELELPGYDALDSEGANLNLAIGVEAVDPVSGAAPHRRYPCQIEKLA